MTSPWLHTAIHVFVIAPTITITCITPPPRNVVSISASSISHIHVLSCYNSLILSTFVSFFFIKWISPNAHLHLHCLSHLPPLKEFRECLSLFLTDFSTNFLMQLSLILITSKVEYGLLPLEEAHSWAHREGYSPKRKCLKNLEMWWMLVDVLEDIIKHAVMYGPGNSCSLSCSISFCFFSYIWKLEKNLVNFNSIDVCFQEFFFFFSPFFTLELCVFQVVCCFWILKMVEETQYSHLISPKAERVMGKIRRKRKDKKLWNLTSRINFN